MRIPTMSGGVSELLSADLDGDHHPFLLVRREQYGTLRDRAGAEPWRTWREESLAAARASGTDPGGEIRGRSVALAQALSVNALAFILDPVGAVTYAEHICKLIAAFDPAVPDSVTTLMRNNADKMLWIYAVPTGNAFVQAVIALDVVHDELPPQALVRAESILREGPAAYFRATPLAWHQGSFAAQAIWPMYERDPAAYRPVVARWLRDVADGISADGVFTGGTGYAGGRWRNPDRAHKGIFGEILAHTGLFPGWYDQDVLQHFQEWLNGYAHTPSRVTWPFGDSAPMAFDISEQSGTERAYRYSALAGGFAAWLDQGAISPASLAAYVLTERPAAAPVAAPSRVFPDGGAWLKETSLDARSLAAVLWNVRDVRDAHAHKETNAVALAAYGSLLLTNGGYAGWSTGQRGFSWEYIHSRAVAANVALIDYAVPASTLEERSPASDNDHVWPNGSGVTDSLLTGRVDFARGDSGDALPNGRHRRDLLFVHPSHGVPGYFVTVDELRPVAAAATGQLVWHGPSADHRLDGPGLHTWWTTDASANGSVALSVYLGTPASATTLHDGVTADWQSGVPGRYLVAHYRLDRDASPGIVTVLFPHDEAHPRASFQRVDKPGATSYVLVGQGEITDCIYRCHPSRPFDTGLGVVVEAAGGLHRYDASGVVLYSWLESVTSMTSPDVTLTCDRPLTVLRAGHDLHLTAVDATTVTLRSAALSAVLVDGHPSPASLLAAGVLRIQVGAGQHVLQLLGGQL